MNFGKTRRGALRMALLFHVRHITLKYMYYRETFSILKYRFGIRSTEHVLENDQVQRQYC